MRELTPLVGNYFQYVCASFFSAPAFRCKFDVGVIRSVVYGEKACVRTQVFQQFRGSEYDIVAQPDRAMKLVD